MTVTARLRRLQAIDPEKQRHGSAHLHLTVQPTYPSPINIHSLISTLREIQRDLIMSNPIYFASGRGAIIVKAIERVQRQLRDSHDEDAVIEGRALVRMVNWAIENKQPF